MEIAFIFFICVFSFVYGKPPVIIEPKNPKDPQTLPNGVTKNVLIIGQVYL